MHRESQEPLRDSQFTTVTTTRITILDMMLSTIPGMTLSTILDVIPSMTRDVIPSTTLDAILSTIPDMILNTSNIILMISTSNTNKNMNRSNLDSRPRPLVTKTIKVKKKTSQVSRPFEGRRCLLDPVRLAGSGDFARNFCTTPCIPHAVAMPVTPLHHPSTRRISNDRRLCFIYFALVFAIQLPHHVVVTLFPLDSSKYSLFPGLHATLTARKTNPADDVEWRIQPTADHVRAKSTASKSRAQEP